MIVTHSLSRPELFNFIDLKGAPCRGADQEWYLDPWQRRAGCGPTTAATILSYLAHQHPSLSKLAPKDVRAASTFVSYMEEIWTKVTPTPRGLDSLSLFSQGCRSFAFCRGVTISSLELPIAGISDPNRATLEQCRHFLLQALALDCPLAFLNFSNGALSNLDSWHWVPLISVEELNDGRLFCAVLDEGKEKQIDFSLWLSTTGKGGGLVVITPELSMHT